MFKTKLTDNSERLVINQPTLVASKTDLPKRTPFTSISASLNFKARLILLPQVHTITPCSWTMVLKTPNKRPKKAHSQASLPIRRIFSWNQRRRDRAPVSRTQHPNFIKLLFSRICRTITLKKARTIPPAPLRVLVDSAPASMEEPALVKKMKLAKMFQLENWTVDFLIAVSLLATHQRDSEFVWFWRERESLQKGMFGVYINIKYKFFSIWYGEQKTWKEK